MFEEQKKPLKIQLWCNALIPKMASRDRFFGKQYILPLSGICNQIDKDLPTIGLADNVLCIKNNKEYH